MRRGLRGLRVSVERLYWGEKEKKLAFAAVL